MVEETRFDIGIQQPEYTNIYVEYIYGYTCFTCTYMYIPTNCLFSTLGNWIFQQKGLFQLNQVSQKMI